MITCILIAQAAAPALPPVNIFVSLMPFVFWAIIGGLIGAAIGKQKGETNKGILTGSIVLPITVTVIALLAYSDPVLLLIPFFGGCVGGAIGQSRGRTIAGIFFGLILGPIGWIILLVGPNPKKEKEDNAKQELLQQQISLQKAQLETMQKLLLPATRFSPPQPPGAKLLLRIARDGQDLGDIEVSKVKEMLKMNELSLQDYYFDVDANEWMPLDYNPCI